MKWRWWMAVGGSSVFVVILSVLVLKWLSKSELYGYWLFLGMPFTQGLISSFILEAKGPVSFGKHAAANLVAILMIVIAMLVFAYEGLMCIVMAFPLVMLASIAASGIAYGIMTSVHRRRRNVVSVSLLALAPLFLLADFVTGGKPNVRSVSTEMVINASPEQIWPHLQNLDSVKTDFWFFESGLAHPVKIRTLEAKLGGARECHLSTGLMRETISEFMPGRRLTFKMHNTPPSMKELNPFGEVHAAHLEGYYESLEGSFDLTPLPGGKTLVRGTSRFQHRFRPVTYWGWWTDYVVHQVHRDVLGEIKRRAERVSPLPRTE